MTAVEEGEAAVTVEDAPVSASEAAHDDSEHEADAHGHAEGDHGLSDWAYVKVAILLAILTAIEVATYFYDFGSAEVPSLLLLMVAKFAVVVAYFMHLRFDSKLFTYMFVGGLVLALGVYAAVGTSMVFWTDPAGCDVGTLC